MNILQRWWSSLASGRRHNTPPEAHPPSPPAEHTPQSPAASASVLTRQAIFNRQMQVAGYAYAAAATGLPGQDQAVLDEVAAIAAPEALNGRALFVHLSERVLDDPRLKALAAADNILVLHLSAAALDDLPMTIGVLSLLRQQGLSLALADGRLAVQHPELAAIVNLAFFRTADYAPPDLLQLAHRLRQDFPLLQLGANGLQSHEEYEVCRRLGFKYFQGDFLTARADWSANAVEPATLGVCRLLDLMRSGAEIAELAELIRLDPLLSFRILRFANSAALATDQEITSIKDAILIIGEDFLYRWLVLAMCTMGPDRPGQQALLEAGLLRGRLMELLAGLKSVAAVAVVVPETCFITGVFSLLDVMLEVRIDHLLGSLSLPAEVRQAILDRQGPCVRLLQLAEACEKADVAQIATVCQMLHIEAGDLNRLQNEAAAWASMTAHSLLG